MTLVIAGKQNQKAGLFITTDSHITQSNTVLVKGFKKVYEIPIRIKGVVFHGEAFGNYRGQEKEYKCFVAMAGSTLVAQHLMNSIRNHLSELYPTYENGEYKLAMSCQQSRFLNSTHYFSEEMFSEQDITSALDANLVSEVVLHSIQAVLDKAANHGGMRTRFKQYQAEFILGFYCPRAADHKLFVFDIAQDPNDNSKAIANKHIIPASEVAVIGMKTAYKNRANTHYASAVQQVTSCDSVMHDFLLNAIQSENSAGNNEIGKPAGLFNFQFNQLTRIELTK